MTAVLKYTPWPELSVITASRSPKMRSSSVTFGDGRLCSSASNPANNIGVSGSVVAFASAKIASASDQVGASHGAIDLAGGWVAIPLITGWLCGSTSPGSSAAAPVSITSASGHPA
jgi:hypothetical protein